MELTSFNGSCGLDVPLGQALRNGARLTGARNILIDWGTWGGVRSKKMTEEAFLVT